MVTKNYLNEEPFCTFRFYNFLTGIGTFKLLLLAFNKPTTALIKVQESSNVWLNSSVVCLAYT